MENHVKFVSYDGEYPCLCSGTLILNIDGQDWSFGHDWQDRYGDEHSEDFKQFWSSGGSCGFISDEEGYIITGDWKVNKSELPEQFRKYADEIYKVMNENIKHPCCGGCI